MHIIQIRKSTLTLNRSIGGFFTHHEWSVISASFDKNTKHMMRDCVPVKRDATIVRNKCVAYSTLCLMYRLFPFHTKDTILHSVSPSPGSDVQHPYLQTAVLKGARQVKSHIMACRHTKTTSVCTRLQVALLRPCAYVTARRWQDGV